LIDPIGSPWPARRSVLIVEDEVLIRLMLVDELTDAGYSTIACATADEAWQVLHSAIRVDLVLTDIRMPGRIDGLELATRVRANWPQIKIVIMSAHLRGRTEADAVLIKPVAVEDLLDCVAKLLPPIAHP
jgi:CheY-like chemotaxis protein